ncbi:hypothetical protein FA13DRAFT_1739506 [Coprinellus micaceus]|uniref:Uncharacterized protein n=1 Tax=Coprinellus micaceus TaxID=71717 RepID=A0A4Y7SR63_COPMI|nr:hypothetical protein FA13DRAFT_1739506 [Coprinellus micaceus]
MPFSFSCILPFPPFTLPFHPSLRSPRLDSPARGSRYCIWRAHVRVAPLASLIGGETGASRAVTAYGVALSLIHPSHASYVLLHHSLISSPPLRILPFLSLCPPLSTFSLKTF